MFPPPSRAAGGRRRNNSPPRRPSPSSNWPRDACRGLDAMPPARKRAQASAGRHRARRIWVWDGEEERARCWHMIVRREVGSVKTIKYSLSNASADAPRLRWPKCRGSATGSSALEDAKGECGLADYQALGWRP